MLSFRRAGALVADRHAAQGVGTYDRPGTPFPTTDAAGDVVAYALPGTSGTRSSS